MLTTATLYQQVLSLESTSSFSNSELTAFLGDVGTTFRQEAQSYDGPQPIKGKCYGATPLLISASHATPHIRDGVPKAAERMTGALAIALAQSLDASVILPISTQPDDPNFDSRESAPYKLKLVSSISSYQLLIDIHGMKDQWGPDICVGTGGTLLTPSSRQLIKDLENNSVQAGYIFTINDPFTSRHQGTVSSFARSQGCEALQIEFSIRSRETYNIASTFLLVWEGLFQWLNRVDRAP